MIFEAYCVGKAHNMLLQYYNYNWSILCRLGTKYATLVVLYDNGVDCVGRVHNMLHW